MSKSETEKLAILAEMVDKLGALEEELDIPEVAIWKAREKAASELRKEICQLAGGDPELPLTLAGESYTAVMGPREKERTLTSLPKLFKRLGQPVFLKTCGFTLTAFDLLSKGWSDKDAFVATGKTGSRSVKTFRLEKAS